MKIGIEGSDKLYDSMDDMFDDWKKEEAEFKKDHYWKWLLKEITSWFDYKWSQISQAWYDFKYGIKNLIRWFPVIWNDRDWDSHYLLLLLKRKLEFMEVLFREKGHHLLAERDARNMRITIELLKRITEDEYYKHPRYKELSESLKNRKEYINYDLINNLKKKYKGCPEMLDRLEKIRVSSDIAFNLSLEEKDFNDMIKILHKHLRSWWD